MRLSYSIALSVRSGSLVTGQQAARMPSPMVPQQTMSAGSVLGSAIESALSQTQQLQQMQQYGMIPGQTAATATAAAAAGYTPAQLMGGAQLMQQQQQQQQPVQPTAALSTTPTASGLTPESILQAYSGVQGMYNKRKDLSWHAL